MIIQIGTEVDESKILWKYNENDDWRRANIDDLIKSYTTIIKCEECEKQTYCYQTVGKAKSYDQFIERWTEPIEWCSKGKRRKDSNI